MSRFEELRKLAVEKGRTFQEYRNEVQRFANQLVRGLRDHLESPGLTVYCLEVDRQHRVVGEPSLFAELCYCYDAFWYFDLGFDFPFTEKVFANLGAAYRVVTSVGVQKAGEEFIVRLPEKNFRVSDDSQRLEFYDHIFTSLKEEMERPWTRPRERLGFVTPEELAEPK